ncbi:MAG: phosphomannomutase [Proteobacteria bacterium]|nr:phosphomannomutase [Pseudomonadota bacterium]
MLKDLSCFKAYDIRGRVPEELDEGLSFKIGVAFAKIFKSKSVIVGYDARLESPKIANALMLGLKESGVDVINIGLCGTEEVYFNTFFHENDGVDGGIMVTASHNPKGFNGMKLVTKGSRPISNDSGLLDIKNMVASLNCEFKEDNFDPTLKLDKTDYINHLLNYVNIATLKPLKIVVNPGNGTAGLVIKELEKHLPFDFIFIHEDVDGTFPNGVPNPILVKNRQSTIDAVLTHKADLGIAWDGDFDRCFLFDEKGNFIEGYYIVGLLAKAFLEKEKGAKIIHDPRLTWNTLDIVNNYEGQAIQSKTGHAFIKERMRFEDAIYGGEMSAHHYFKDFAYCDSGMIPWLLVTELMSKNGVSLSSLVEERIQKFPCSGELNYKVKDANSIIDSVLNHFKPLNPILDQTDGISLSFDMWRLNLRISNTESLLRLNIETKGDERLVNEKVKEVEMIINQQTVV